MGKAEVRKWLWIGITLSVIAVVIMTPLFVFHIVPPTNPGGSIPDGPIILVASESSNSIISGEILKLTIEMHNTAPYAIYRDKGNSWPVIDGRVTRLSLSPCSFYFPYGFSVFYGNLSLDSVNTRTPLAIWEPGAVYSCPADIVFNYYVMHPESDVASLIGPNPPMNITMHSTLDLSGYWVHAIPSFHGNTSAGQDYQFVHFLPGNYTILISDEWGSLLLLHFSVK